MEIIRQHTTKFIILATLLVALLITTSLLGGTVGGNTLRETALIRGDVTRAIMRNRFGDDTLDVLTYINQSLSTTSDTIVPYDSTFKDSGRTKSIQFKDLAHDTIYLVMMTAATQDYEKQIILTCPPETIVKQTCATADGEDL